MKRCPECRRDYYDDTLLYCLDDGNALLEGPAAPFGVPPSGGSSADEPATAILSEPGAVATGFLSGNEPATAILSEPPASAGGQCAGENPTRPFIHTTAAEAEPQNSLDGQSERQSLSANRAAKPRGKVSSRQRQLAIVGIVALTLAGGFFAYKYFAPAKQIESIAVMPFVNESGNADVEYLSDGMTETLISSLSQLPNLNVKPRSSVFRYKGKETDPLTIGRELNVQAILNGRVVQRGQELSLFVELIDVAFNKVVWSQQYNRRPDDLVRLQSEVAHDVSSQLKTRLSGAEELKLAKTYTTNPVAYQFYLKGNYFRTKYNEEGYRKGIEYYRKAIELDPNYALAYIGMANAYQTAADWYLPPHEAYSKAKAAAMKALELDNSLADGHSVLGSVAFWYEWDWPTSERELKLAIELDPTNPAAYGTYAFYFAAMGRNEEAIKQSEIAQSLAPLDLQFNLNSAGFYNAAGQFDRTIEQARKTIELDQNYWFSWVLLGLAYERKGMLPEAIAAIEKAHSLDSNPAISGYLGYVYAVAGKRAEAQKMLDELKELSKRQYVPAFHVAFIYAGLNDKDQAFEWLNKAYEERSGLALIKAETVFDNLHSDPRFKDLLKRMNLPE